MIIAHDGPSTCDEGRCGHRQILLVGALVGGHDED